jgi:hypothetical protein
MAGIEIKGWDKNLGINVTTILHIGITTNTN